MKKVIFLILIVIVATNCKKDNNDNENKNCYKRQNFSIKKIVGGYSLSDAKKVLVIDIHIGTFLSRFVDIIDGSFSFSSPKGVATALVFLDDQNKYIGTLSSQGLNLLPLFKL
jgi:hypothetical protein